MAFDGSAATFRFGFGEEASAPLPADAPPAQPCEPEREEFPDLQPPAEGWRCEPVAVPGGAPLLKAGGGAVAAAAAALGLDSLASDLLPGRYEGGVKLWECALDLCAFLRGPQAPRLAGARVLELGCGQGLPACEAALQGAACVTLQDYNAPVLHLLTARVLAANLAERPGAAPPLRFLSGDWAALAEGALLPRAAFDLVLSADTIYSEASQPKLLRLMQRSLAPGGVALVVRWPDEAAARAHTSAGLQVALLRSGRLRGSLPGRGGGDGLCGGRAGAVLRRREQPERGDQAVLA